MEPPREVSADKSALVALNPDGCVHRSDLHPYAAESQTRLPLKSYRAALHFLGDPLPSYQVVER